MDVIHFEFCSKILYQQLSLTGVSKSAPGELPYFSFNFNPNQTHLDQLIKVFRAT